jgi:uracil-DNA glycosylase family 4
VSRVSKVSNMPARLHRCPSCSPDYHYVFPSGPIPSRIMAVGEAPARMELRYGYPFAGESGEELDSQYFPLAHISRSSVYTTNACKCARPGFVNPTRAEAAACAACHLGTELRLVQPQVVITLGAVASSLFGIGNLDHSHGVPTRGSFEHWEGWVFPVFHPAQGIRVPSLITRIRTDFQHLGEVLPSLLDGTYTPPIDPYPNPIYYEVTTQDELLVALHHYPDDQPWLGVDTESDTTHGMAGAPPWCLTFSPRPGDGYLIRSNQCVLLDQFSQHLARFRPLVVLHHALHDVPVCRQMGVDLPHWTDSMQMAYILQDIPMGLKALAYRLCGMAMSDFTDVVHPHARQVAESYMMDVILHLESKWQYSHLIKSGRRKGESELRFNPATPQLSRTTYNRAQALLRALRGEVSLDAKDEMAEDGEEGEEADPWKRWDGWREEVREEMVGIMGGPLPRPSITQVPFGEALRYAVRDADATGRVYGELRKRFGGREVRRGIVV